MHIYDFGLVYGVRKAFSYPGHLFGVTIFWSPRDPLVAGWYFGPTRVGHPLIHCEPPASILPTRLTVEWGAGRRENRGGSILRPQAAEGRLHFRFNLFDSSAKITIFPNAALERGGCLARLWFKKYWFSKVFFAFLVRRRSS